MREPRLCQIVCMTSFTQEGANDVKEKIDDDYRINMLDTKITCIYMNKSRSTDCSGN
jgi:hypothetical protein